MLDEIDHEEEDYAGEISGVCYIWPSCYRSNREKFWHFPLDLCNVPHRVVRKKLTLWLMDKIGGIPNVDWYIDLNEVYKGRLEIYTEDFVALLKLILAKN